jgi:hypothetical protein
MHKIIVFTIVAFFHGVYFDNYGEYQYALVIGNNQYKIFIYDKTSRMAKDSAGAVVCTLNPLDAKYFSACIDKHDYYVGYKDSITDSVWSIVRSANHRDTTYDDSIVRFPLLGQVADGALN